jgi:topoisomerase IV subunit B
MDEAIAGHATRIEVQIGADGFVTSPTTAAASRSRTHPKFQGQVDARVIMCTLHAGGKFDSKAYETSGGCTASASRWSTRCPTTSMVEVARDQQLYRQAYSRGKPTGKLEKVGKVQNRRGTTCASTPTRRSSAPRRSSSRAPVQDDALQGLPVRRRRIRWSCDESELLRGVEDVPEKASFHFPAG